MMPYVKKSDLDKVVELLNNALEMGNLEDSKGLIKRALDIITPYLHAPLDESPSGRREERR